MSSEAVVDALNRIVFGGVAMTAAALEQATGGQEITFTQWRAILFTGEADSGARVSDIAARLMAGLSGTSRLLRRLEDRGILTTHRDERDRRVTRVLLTAEGHRIRTAVLEWRRQRIAEITHDLAVPRDAERVLAELGSRFEVDGRRSSGQPRRGGGPPTSQVTSCG